MRAAKQAMCMNRLNSSIYPLVGLSVVLSLSAIIAVAAHWPNRGAVVITPAAAVQQPAVQHIKVVMHDPGCHWFQTSSGYKQQLSVKGTVVLTNMDEAALKIVGPSGTKVDKVGSNVRLSPGAYAITMIGQASDDNHLKLHIS
jgi:hypothetical protein